MREVKGSAFLRGPCVPKKMRIMDQRDERSFGEEARDHRDCYEMEARDERLYAAAAGHHDYAAEVHEDSAARHDHRGEVDAAAQSRALARDARRKADKLRRTARTRQRRAVACLAARVTTVARALRRRVVDSIGTRLPAGPARARQSRDS